MSHSRDELLEEKEEIIRPASADRYKEKESISKFLSSHGRVAPARAREG